MSALAAPPSTDALEDDGWRLALADYAERMSKGKWRAWKWLRYVAQICEDAVFEGNGRVIINAPPQHGKSELLSHWLPTWFLDLYPDKRVILVSYADNLASGFGRLVRNEFEYTRDEQSDEAMRHLAQLAPDSAAVSDWKTTAGGGMRTAGIDGTLTGKGGDIILIDDPFKNWQEAQSPTRRQHVIDEFNSTIYPRKQPNTTFIIVQTRWHERDLSGYLLKEHADKWQHVRLPALAEANDPLGRKEGEALCADRFSAEDLGKTKVAMGSQMFAGLYQQRPAPAEGNIIQRDWIRHYDTLPDKIDKWWQSWDLTFDDTKHGSYVVGQVWCQSGSNCYLVHQIRKRMDFVASIAAVMLLTKSYPQATRKKVEKKANGAAVLAVLRSKITGLIPVEPKGDKPTRLRAVSPLFEAGNVWVPRKEHVAWVEDWVEEITTGPLAAEHDDQCDATSQALHDVQTARLGPITLDLEVGARPSPWKEYG